MRASINEIKGKVIRDNETYIVEDNRELDGLVLSKTTLHPGQETGGHKHDGIDEIYIFTDGVGAIKIDGMPMTVLKGDIVLIHAGKHHKVYNMGSEDMIFLSIFQTYEREN